MPTSTSETRDLTFGIYDRLYDHGHCTADVVLAPATADGEPDWERADPANVEALPADEWPEDEQQAKRACVIVSNVDGCDPESTFIVRLDPETRGPEFVQVHGPEADRPIAENIIARDIGAEPAVPPKTKLMESLDALAAKFERETEERHAKAANQNDQKIGKFTVTRFRDLGHARPKKHIVKGVRAAGEASYTAAKPGCGKSVIETDIAYHIAAGREWHGRKVVRGLAVYFAAERKALTDRRVMALQQHYGDFDIPLVVIGGKPNLTDDKRIDVTNMVQIIRGLEKEYFLPCRHVTIDTLARTFGGKDQNAAADMMKYISSIDIMMEALPEAHINVIHHEGHDTGRAKGAIDLDGAVDVSFRVTHSGGTYKLICDGANDGVEGDVLCFTMRSVTLGTDEDGEPITAPVVVRATDVAGLVANTKTVQAKAETDAMTIITELASGGHPVGGGLWLAKYQELYPDDNPRTVKSRWDRAVKALEAGGRVHSSGKPKVYALDEMQILDASEMQAFNASASASSDPSDERDAKMQMHPLSKGCINASASAVGDELTEDQIPAFLRGAA